MKSYFITASGTGIGKTMLTCGLVSELRQNNKKIFAQKPVISGWSEEDNDTYQILSALGLGRTEADIVKVTCYRFMAPLSPDMAAKREGIKVDFDTIVSFCKPSNDLDIHLIEGAGGVMTPVNENHTMRDLIAALRIPAILVVGSYLGAISHALSAESALKEKNIPIKAMIISESENGASSIEEMHQTLKNFTHAPIFLIHRRTNNDRFDNEIDSLMRVL